MCMIDDVYGDCVVLHERHQVARKPHKCHECNRVINIGERYMVERTVYEGEASTHKTCYDCKEKREWLSKECGGFLYGCVVEDFAEHQPTPQSIGGRE